ncbi:MULTISPECIES: NAD(P)H-dependent oxidoreductase [unclassified Cobetia]|uniref:NAD(P)H-dependent oxidoreductase n=1 Tax=unclassified Cobetia TaxID=2609414 RepID=UPI0020984483|nr:MULTISPECIES: NAD(P)H-dependent oxidoreductase [unclassified Cobetia]MCO7231693.1 NAD(P)H-dependent oxidoreductase [Cobetia sp. Dlab-2-AX]MCO7234991.1 NAD(P)H-dependent oxidoreductase [Cobetia sp. Dlab-2-U]
MKVLVYLAHPRPDRSEVNATLFRQASNAGHVTSVDLYATYPSMDIDIDAEQRRLVEHDVIVFQHPFYWYSCPALLKEWIDLVLEYGFAYGPQGQALKGKQVMHVISCGAARHAYTQAGYKGVTVPELLRPFKATWQLCQVEWLPPLVLFDAGRAEADGRLDEHCQDYRALLDLLHHTPLDAAQLSRHALFNDYLSDAPFDTSHETSSAASLASSPSFHSPRGRN